MSKNRYSARTDANQPKIVRELLDAGLSVEVGYDDLIVGGIKNGVPTTLWVEVKTVDCLSKKTGLIKESCKTPAQRVLDKTYIGAREYATNSADIISWFGIVLK